MEAFWAAVVAAVITGGVGLGGVWLGHSMQASTARNERRSAYLQQHNDRAADALGQLLMVMSTIRPDAVAFDAPGSRGVDRYTAAVEDSQQLQRQLTVVTASHPSKEMREVANRLLRDFNKAVGDVGMMLMLIGQDKAREARGQPRTDAVASWEAAYATLEHAISLMHNLTE